MSCEANHVRCEAVVTQEIENTSTLMRRSPSRLTKHPAPEKRGHVKDSPLQTHRRIAHVKLPERQRTRGKAELPGQQPSGEQVRRRQRDIEEQSQQVRQALNLIVEALDQGTNVSPET